MQKMLYFKFNLIYPEFHGQDQKFVKKHFINPQWLRNIKSKKYPFWRLDILFSNKKYNQLQIINNGGWHFTNIKTPEEIHHKMKNFLHHFEYNNSGLDVNDIRKLIQEKKALYNYKADKRQQKWSQNSQLVKVDVSMLPNYIKKNLDKYQRWLET